MSTTSWTRAQAIDLRNRAAARAQVCAPIVREAEELDAFIDLLDELLGGTPTPHADKLDERVPVVDRDYEDPSASASASIERRVLQHLEAREPDLVRPREVAQALNISPSVARMTLSRLKQAQRIERPSYGCYRAPRR